MKMLSCFLTKFTSLIIAVLSCFDRVIFKGHLPISNGPALEGFVDHVLKIRRCDFMAFAEEQSEIVVDHAQRLAQEAGAEYHFLKGSRRKDKLVDRILRERPIFEGLICVFCCMECCPSFKLLYGKGRPSLVNARRQQRVLYFFPRSRAGLIHIRLTLGSRLLSRSPSTATPGWLSRCKNDVFGSTSTTTPSQLWTIPKPLRIWPIRSSSRTEDPRPPGAAGQSLDEPAMVSQPQLLLSSTKPSSPP